MPKKPRRLHLPTRHPKQLKPRPNRRQPTPDELKESLLNFIRTKFYQQHGLEFAKDTPRLLEWVVLRLAVYLDDKGVWIDTARYQEIMVGDKGGILMEAIRHGDTGNITYLPAWLGRCVESHLAVHGEKYYEEGKRNRENIQTHVAAVLKGIQPVPQAPNPMYLLVEAAKLLKAKKRPQKPALKQDQSVFKFG